jgi:hypothetical protein
MCLIDEMRFMDTSTTLNTENNCSSCILDCGKYHKLMCSLEQYSIKLDKLIETTSNIEQESKKSKRINKCR